MGFLYDFNEALFARQFGAELVLVPLLTSSGSAILALSCAGAVKSRAVVLCKDL